jgi:hypothetical protein
MYMLSISFLCIYICGIRRYAGELLVQERRFAFFSNDASFLSAMGCRPFGGASLEAPEHPARVRGHTPLLTPRHRIVASLNDIISYAIKKQTVFHRLLFVCF